jgi:hypothetical protein
MEIYWPVREFGVRENWKCASLKTPEARRAEVMGHIDPKIVDGLLLEKRKLGKASLVQLATRTKRRIHDMVRSCSIGLNGVNTNSDINIIPLGSYDVLIGMDWLDKHHAILDCHIKTFTCLDGYGK